ncbi:DUF4384 domain-containing protein [Tolypothrix sp. PCC 7910]|uniref:DUF4384 domain-containing protein n=1 Tax=Tolypothrix sp. PCC 7910 TaxID=2099387 RepID=UPI0014278F67|nr:DUF4384 domain-containing protein [Tolypothrix sp. PCC 7910]QIR37239.1 DUF4384 domain-containing protein [Tolypothrix sp. PCC 7910]
MAERSLVASEAGVLRAKQALVRRSLNQRALSAELEFAYSTVNNFFNRRPIYRTKFEEICTFLGLDWRDLVPSYTDEGQETTQTPIDKVWQQLQTLGSPTQQMGLVLVKEETLGWGWESQSRYEKSVSLGNYIRVEINLDTPGYLLLLQKDTAGQVWCFCPSCFAPQPHINTGKTSLPQEGSPLTSFPIEGIPGKEVLLAVITEDMPNLNWLPQGKDDPLELTDIFLLQLLKLINNTRNCRVLYTEYEIK